MISLVDLAIGRAAFAQLMPDTAMRSRPGVPVDDGGGETTPGTPIVIGPLACRVQAVTAPSQPVQGEQQTLVTAWQVAFPLNAGVPDVKAKDTLAATVTGTGETLTLEVIGPIGPTGYELERTFECRKVG